MRNPNPLNLAKAKHLAALTRAKNSGDPHKVVAAVEAAFSDFDRIGWPDQWARWQNAKDDAEWQISKEVR